MSVAGQLAPPSAVSGAVEFPVSNEDETLIVAVDIPGDTHWVVRPANGMREALVSRVLLEEALVSGNPAQSPWSSPELLGELLRMAREIAADVFGSAVDVNPEVVESPESLRPVLAFLVSVPKSARPLRSVFMLRYSRETVVPLNSPVPALLWAYTDAVQA